MELSFHRIIWLAQHSHALTLDIQNFMGKKRGSGKTPFLTAKFVEVSGVKVMERFQDREHEA